MELTVEIIGFKAFKGTVDGKPLDGGSLYGVVKMDTRYNRIEGDNLNWKSGHGLEEWKVPNAAAAMRLSNLNPSISHPIVVKLEVERVTNGRETTELVVDVRPVESVKPLKAAA